MMQMKDRDIKKAFESITPSEDARKRMFNAIINKKSAADASAMEENIYEKSKTSPWYVRFKTQIGICGTVAVCAAAFAITIMNPGIKNIKQNNILTETIDYSGDDLFTYTETTTTISENNFKLTEKNKEFVLKNNDMDNTAAKTTKPDKDSKDENMSSIYSESSEYITQATEIITKPAVTTIASTTLTTVKTIETVTFTTTVSNPIYKDFLDFNCITWNNKTYTTNYTKADYSSLSDYLGSSAALNSDRQTYSIILYKIKDMPVEQGFAVQYAGRTDYYIFYNIG